MRPEIDKGDIQVEIDSPPPNPIDSITADPDGLRQVMENLLLAINASLFKSMLGRRLPPSEAGGAVASIERHAVNPLSPRLTEMY